ncbi:MAG TPA: alpha-amylase family protein [Ohtaekwangia sp.]|nr:alpha-amylase family protein [Ohtaekwangia sp.]
MKSALLYFVIALICCGCVQTKEKIPPVSTMEKNADKIVIYQIMTRLFGNQSTTNVLYGTIGQNGVGKFNDINNAALKAIKELGVSHVWYTGIIEHAVLTDYTKYGIPLDDADVVKGRAGSPYAIKDYYDVNPDLAVDVPNRMAEFTQLVERTHQNGLKVIIDFVPNHVARAYKSDAKPTGVMDLGEQDDKSVSFKSTNNFYYLPGQSFQVPRGYTPLGNNTFPTKDGKFEETPAKVTGNDQFTATPGVNEWFETVKLNYGVDIQNERKTYFDPIPDTWVKMKDVLVFWAGKNIDGFRCDMAEMVPVEFWNYAIPEVKKINPDIIFIAEIYNPSQYKNYIEQGKFDFLYDKVQLYDTLRYLIGGQRSTADIATIQQSLTGINDRMLHFLENHDEQRVASRFFAGDPWKAVPAMVISATIDQGPVMIYFGQEVGEPGLGIEGFQGDDGRTTIFDYWGVPEHQKWMNGGKFDGGLLSMEQKQLRWFYTELLSLAKTNAAIAYGDYIDITASNINAGNINGKVSAYIRFSGTERLLIINSFNDTEQEAKITIPSDAMVKMGLNPTEVYIARDLLWRELEVGLDKELSIALKLKPYSSYILKIK